MHGVVAGSNVEGPAGLPARCEGSAGLVDPAGRRADHLRASERDRDERWLFTRYRRFGDQAARERLVERFMPLARQLARRYQRPNEGLEDLMQVAAMGLVKAIDRFDPQRMNAFSSFAVPTILGELKRHFRDKGWAVRVPRDLQETVLRVERNMQTLGRELGRTPSAAELADRLELTVEQVLEALEAAGAFRAVSLDQHWSHDGEANDSYAETLGQEDNGYGLAEDRATIANLMTALPVREREVLRLRFAEDLTQAEIGERIGVSQMQVSRLIRQALGRLQAQAG
jgi:RNA polymerase sigma-B factor